MRWYRSFKSDIIVNQFGYVFGGYASVEWNSNRRYAKDSKAFIFGIYPILKAFKVKNVARSLYFGEEFLQNFGCGNITIRNDCDKNQNSLSRVPNRYDMDESFKLVASTQKPNEYFKFKVIDYEVFLLEFV